MFGGGNYDSRRPRRVADDPARLAGRRRDRAARRGRTRSPCASAAARAVQAVFAELGFPPITDEEVRLATTCLDSRDLPDRDRAADVARRRPRAGRGASAGSTSRARSTGAASPTSPRRSSACSASASRPTTSRPRRSSSRTARVVSAVNDPNDYRGPGHRLPPRGRALGAAPRGCRTRSTRGCSEPAPTTAPPVAGRRGAAERGDEPDEVVIAVGPGVRRGAVGDDQRPAAPRRARGDLSTASREGGAEPRVVRVRRSLGRRVHRPRRRAALGLGHRGRAAVEGHGADPPRRPPAARQPRALRDGAAR